MTPIIPSRYLRKASVDKDAGKGYTVASSVNEPTFFNPTGRDEEKLTKWETIYKTGGIASQCVDAYAYFILSNGWTIEGRSKALRETCEEFTRNVQLRRKLWSFITDSIVYGRPFLEIGYGNGGKSDMPVVLNPLPPKTVRVDATPKGKITGYTQIIRLPNQKTIETKFAPDEMLSEPLFPSSGDLYGMSLVGRAYDDILHDAKISEATAQAILRHGFPKYHIQVGMEGEQVDPMVLTKLDSEFKGLGPRSEIVTLRDVVVNNLDKDALPNVKDLNEWAQGRMVISMGIPEVVMGLGRGSTEASSYVEMAAFYDKISMLQDVIEIIVNTLFDKVTKREGAVTFNLSDANPEDENKKADRFYKLVTMNPMEPFKVVPVEHIQHEFGIHPELYRKDKEYDKEYGFDEEEEQPQEEGENPEEGGDASKDKYFNAINSKRPNMHNPKDQAFGKKKSDE